MVYLLAAVAIVVLLAVLDVLIANRRAQVARTEAAHQAQRAAAAEASATQHARTAAEILGVQQRHQMEEKVSNEKLAKGDRDHLAGDW